MKNQAPPKKLKTILISFSVVALLLSGIFYYSNGMENKPALEPKLSSSAKGINPDLTDTAREKEEILQDLRDLKKTYDEIIIENKNISAALIEERDKVMKLLADLSASQGNRQALQNYKKQAGSLRVKLNMLSIENNILKKENKAITQQMDSAKVTLKVSQKSNEGLKRDLANTVEKFSKLEISSTSVVTYRLKGSGELIVTDKANKVGGINISFVIAKNEIAKPIDKIYYIQVANSEGTVLGDDNMRTHQYKTLTYSMASNVKYENKMVRVSENLMGKSFAKGTYYVNIYDGEDLVGESTFTLK